MTDGYTSIEAIASETLENIEKIEGFDADLAKEILDRSKKFYKGKRARKSKTY